MASISKGCLVFRHPILRGTDGKGRLVRRGISKLPMDEQELIKAELEQMVKLRPRTWQEAPLGLKTVGAFDFYFHPIYQNSWAHQWHEYMKKEQAPTDIQNLRTELLAAQARIREMGSQIERMGQLIAELTKAKGSH